MASKVRKGVTDTAATTNQRLSIRVSPDAARRLGIHSVMSGIAPGRLVEKLIDEHLKDWRVQAISGDSSRKSDRLDLNGNVSSTASLAAL